MTDALIRAVAHTLPRNPRTDPDIAADCEENRAIPGIFGYNGVLQQSGPGGADTPRGQTPEGLVPMPPHDNADPAYLTDPRIKHHEKRCATCKQVLPRSAYDPRVTPRGTRHSIFASCRECRANGYARDTFPKPNPEDPTGQTMILTLTQGKVAIVDREDAERLAEYRWCAYWDKRKQRWGAMRRRRIDEPGTSWSVHLPRFILECPDGLQVDHIDGDPLNNAGLNIRICTHTQNLWNRPVRQNAGFKGVDPTASGKWSASITANGKKHYLGTFATAEDAARAYDAKARELHGEFAFQNFPESDGGE